MTCIEKERVAVLKTDLEECVQKIKDVVELADGYDGLNYVSCTDFLEDASDVLGRIERYGVLDYLTFGRGVELVRERFEVAHQDMHEQIQQEQIWEG